MGRHVSGDCPELDRLLDEACAEMGREIDSLCIPRLAGVVLGGGYGRGEGGVRECKVDGMSAAECRLSNDLDFFAITEDGVPEAETVASIGAALKPIAEKWKSKLGIDVDFAVKTPCRLKHDEERIMVQEMLRGYFDVAGRKGEELFSGIAKIDAAQLPWMEAARLLMNRGMGLLFALAESRNSSSSDFEKRDFVNRNINKCILGAGDARLIARHGYKWRSQERSESVRDDVYSAAVAWKFRPREESVCEWETARTVWRGAYEEIMDAGERAGELGRSLREAARWVVRRRTFGRLPSFGQNCTVRVLKCVARSVEARASVDPSLRRDWEVFN